MGKIIDMVKKNPRLYVIARAIQNSNSKKLQDMLYGYYEITDKVTTLLIEHYGEKNPDKTIYYINEGVDSTCSVGLCGLLRLGMDKISYSDSYGFVPCIHWGKGCGYYDSGMDSVSENVFDYYFELIGGVSFRETSESSRVVEAAPNHLSIKRKAGELYTLNQDAIKQFSQVYKKYIRLNERTKKFFIQEIGKLLKDKRTLGVHVRGSDFRQGLAYHPIAVSPEEFLEKTQDVFQKGNYDQIFLATDDKFAYELFKEKMGEAVVCYEDVMRSDNDESVVLTQSTRPLHRYKLGLEVLRDVYTLACCKGIIVGATNVAYMARTVNLVMEKGYDEVVILDHGVHKSTQNKRKMKQTRKKAAKRAAANFRK